MSYLLKGWGLVILADDGFIQVLGVKAYSQLAIGLLGICQAPDPWGGLSLLGDDSLLDHLCYLLFYLLLVLDGNFPPSVLDWGDSGVSLDVILTAHVSNAVKAVGE